MRITITALCICLTGLGQAVTAQNTVENTAPVAAAHILTRNGDNKEIRKKDRPLSGNTQLEVISREQRSGHNANVPSVHNSSDRPVEITQMDSLCRTKMRYNPFHPDMQDLRFQRGSPDIHPSGEAPAIKADVLPGKR